MPNVAVLDHPMIGQRLTCFPMRPDLTHLPIDSRTVARPGDAVDVLAVFHDWNDVPGLTIFWVLVLATGIRTHFSTTELGLPYSSGA